MSSLKCSCIGCDNIATHTWSGHPTCDSCGSPSRINKTSKPFDITKHEFSDPAWSINEIDVGQGYIDFYNHETCTDDGDADTHVLDKDDAIAIAKALGVTGEDLK